MAQVDGGELFVRVLRSAGIHTVFTLHGGHLDAILQAAAQSGMRLIDMRHEQAAGHAPTCAATRRALPRDACSRPGATTSTSPSPACA